LSYRVGQQCLQPADAAAVVYSRSVPYWDGATLRTIEHDGTAWRLRGYVDGQLVADVAAPAVQLAPCLVAADVADAGMIGGGVLLVAATAWGVKVLQRALF
jgi:hypothetical protein